MRELLPEAAALRGEAEAEPEADSEAEGEAGVESDGSVSLGRGGSAAEGAADTGDAATGSDVECTGCGVVVGATAGVGCTSGAADLCSGITGRGGSDAYTDGDEVVAPSGA